MLEFLNMLIFKQKNDVNLCNLIGLLETIDFFWQISQYPIKEGSQIYKHYQTLTKNVAIIMASPVYISSVYAIKVKDLENKLLAKEKELANYVKQQNYFWILKWDFEKFVSMAKYSMEKNTYYSPFSA